MMAFSPSGNGALAAFSPESLPPAAKPPAPSQTPASSGLDRECSTGSMRGSRGSRGSGGSSDGVISLQHLAAPQQLSTDDYESHVYEFNNLELEKPTRMNKVYMVFACQVSDCDLLCTVYGVPTIGICR